MSSFISLEDAVTMTTNYRVDRDTILNSTYQGTTYLPNAELFQRSQVDTLLARSGCEGLRIYYGMDDDLKVHFVIVGVDDKGMDILPISSAEDTVDFIIDRGERCPSHCDNYSVLNT